MRCVIQYIAWNWPWFSLYGQHIRITWFSLYGIRFPFFRIRYPYALVPLYGNTAHCSGYGIAMGCYGLSIVPRTAIVASQWYDHYCFTEYARTWARHSTTPWQCECMVITDFQLINSWYDSVQFVTHFCEITPYILRGRNCRKSTVPGLFNKCSGLRSSDTMDTLSSWWLGCWRHVCVGKPFFGKSLGL